LKGLHRRFLIEKLRLIIRIVFEIYSLAWLAFGLKSAGWGFGWGFRTIADKNAQILSEKRRGL